MLHSISKIIYCNFLKIVIIKPLKIGYSICFYHSQKSSIYYNKCLEEECENLVLNNIQNFIILRNKYKSLIPKY